MRRRGEERRGEGKHHTYNLLLRELCSREQVDSLKVPKFQIVAEKEDEEKLGYIFLSSVSIQRLFAA